MKRILVLGINYAPELTGIGKYTGEFCEFMAAEGFEVQVVTGYPYYPSWEHIDKKNPFWYSIENIAGVEVCRCPIFIPNPQKIILRILQDISFFISSFIAVTLLLFKRQRADVIFVISPSVLNGLTGLWYKLWYQRVKFVYHVQDLQIDAAGDLGMIKSKWLLIVLKKIELFIFRNSDIVSTISEGMQTNIQAKSKAIKSSVLFPNWSNIDKIFPCKPECQFYQRYRLPTNKLIVLYSGSIGEKQGLDMILTTAMLVGHQYNDIHFVISGVGPYFNVLQQKSAHIGLKNLQFLPLLDIDDYNQLLNVAWLHLVIQKEVASDLLMPSKITSIVAAGGAVVATASANTSLFNLIHQHQFGWTIDPDSPEALRNIIFRLASEQELIALAKANAFEYANKNIRKEIVINKFLSAIDCSYSRSTSTILETN
ncbi:MAG: WcaI family glycosyltransferase [Bacteroidetes bacterium]|nr:WcaI family glycosyltransferase [Bacteroidota bacterium]